MFPANARFTSCSLGWRLAPRTGPETQEARRAAALDGAVLEKGFLNGVQTAVSSKPFHRNHGFSLGAHRQVQARVHGTPIDHHRAGPAFAFWQLDLVPVKPRSSRKTSSNVRVGLSPMRPSGLLT